MSARRRAGQARGAPAAVALVSIAALAAAPLLLARGDGDDGGAAAEEWVLETPAPEDDGVPAAVEGWESISCAGCHEQIAREWAGTRHALSWIDPHYQKALKGLRRPKSCHGCHVPEPLHPEPLPQKPEARGEEEQRGHGITCETCHAGPDGTVLGPWGAATEAHRSVRSASFTAEGQDRLCIACHATNIGPVIGVARDLVERDEPARGQSCVGCHMAPVERPAAMDPETDDPSPVRAGRSHALQTPRDPRFLRLAFGLRAVDDGSEVALVVTNRCGHRLPGLDTRRIELSVTALDAQGATREERTFTIDKQAFLPAGGELRIPLARPAAKLSVRGLHHAPGFAAPVEFLAAELVPAAVESE